MAQAMTGAGGRIGSYHLTRCLGEGGMGSVYEAVHPEMGRRVAIKVLHTGLAAQPEVVARFLNEARAVNRVEHPGVVSIFEWGWLPDGAPYLVMELLRGARLSERLGRLGHAGSALPLLHQVSATVAAVHACGIVHRDLKPENVMVVPDSLVPGGERVKVLDFGIAKLPRPGGAPGGTAHRTRAGVVLGTPTYMAPEQCRGATFVTDRSDVYALGVMLYQELAGQPPFQADSGWDVMAMHMYTAPRPLAELQPAVPPALAALVHAMLAKASAERPAMAQVTVQLGLALAHPGAEAGPPSGVSPAIPAPSSVSTLGQARGEKGWPQGPLRWRRTLVGGGVAGALLGLLAVGWAWPLLRTPAPVVAAALPPADNRPSTPGASPPTDPVPGDGQGQGADRGAGSGASPPVPARGPAGPAGHVLAPLAPPIPGYRHHHATRPAPAAAAASPPASPEPGAPGWVVPDFSARPPPGLRSPNYSAGPPSGLRSPNFSGGPLASVPSDPPAGPDAAAYLQGARDDLRRGFRARALDRLLLAARQRPGAALMREIVDQSCVVGDLGQLRQLYLLLDEAWRGYLHMRCRREGLIGAGGGAFRRSP